MGIFIPIIAFALIAFAIIVIAQLVVEKKIIAGNIGVELSYIAASISATKLVSVINKTDEQQGHFFGLGGANDFVLYLHRTIQKDRLIGDQKRIWNGVIWGDLILGNWWQAGQFSGKYLYPQRHVRYGSRSPPPILVLHAKTYRTVHKNQPLFGVRHLDISALNSLVLLTLLLAASSASPAIFFVDLYNKAV